MSLYIQTREKNGALWEEHYKLMYHQAQFKCSSHTYKVFTRRDIPFPNVLVKWWCTIKHTNLTNKRRRSYEKNISNWFTSDVNALAILTKFVPLDTSQFPISWLNDNASLNISACTSYKQQERSIWEEHYNLMCQGDVNALAILTKFVPLDTFQFPMSWLNDDVLRNISTCKWTNKRNT